MIGEIFGTITGINAAIDLVKSMKDTSDAMAVREIKANLLDQLVAAKAAQLDQLEHYKELEAEVVRLRNWEADKQRYELVRLGDGGNAYALKEAERSTATPHCLCANCYEKGNKRYLTPAQRAAGTLWKCSECSFETIDRTTATPPQPRRFSSGIDHPFG